MNFLAFDLELNQPWEQPSDERIIQVGAVVGNVISGEILDEFSCHVRLPDGHKLNPYIVTLTGITPDQVEGAGMSLEWAYDMMCDMKERHKCQVSPIQWGGGDSWCLKKELERNLAPGAKLEWKLGYRCFDAKTLYQSLMISQGKPFQGGLAKSLTRLGLKFSGAKHQAMDDARNTFLIYVRLLNILRIGAMRADQLDVKYKHAQETLERGVG